MTNLIRMLMRNVVVNESDEVMRSSVRGGCGERGGREGTGEEGEGRGGGGGGSDTVLVTYLCRCRTTVLHLNGVQCPCGHDPLAVCLCTRP